MQAVRVMRGFGKVYRQILVHEVYTPLQSIIWRENPDEEIKEFELLTVTYGTKPASFLATRCLQKLTELERINYPEAAEVICNDFYMDDLLTGVNSESEGIKLKNDLLELLGKAGFKLHKWNTNMFREARDNTVDITKEARCKLLGVLWCPNQDTLHYKVTSNNQKTRVTKRAMLSQVVGLFDTLDLIGPVVTAGKILSQDLWTMSIEWESISMHIYKA